MATTAGETAPGFEIRPAWRLGDPRIEADAIAFWGRLGILPPEVKPEDRARELVAVAYADGRIVAVATAALEVVPGLKARFAMIRGATDPDYRRRGAMWALAGPAREILERWALDHPGERLAGLLGVNDPETWGELARMPVAPGAGLMLAGHTEDGRQIRVSWFDHFRFDGPVAPAPPLSDDLIRQLASGLELRPAWRLGDRTLEQEVIEFWTRLTLLPPGVDPEQRASELAAVAYKDGRIAGVTTIALARMEQVRARLGMIRGAVDPEFRRSGVGLALLFFTRPLIERWSMDHPEERVGGLGAVIQNPELAAWETQPYWPKTRFGLIGFAPDGNQIRVSWFKDFRLDQAAAGAASLPNSGS